MNDSLRVIMAEWPDSKTSVELSTDGYTMFYVDHCRKVQRKGWVVVSRYLTQDWNEAHQKYIDLCNSLAEN